MHHASADTYQKVLAYFKPQFTLGLTATPERTDDNTVILDIFKIKPTSWTFKPAFRFPTNGSGEIEKIAQALDAYMQVK